MAFNKIQFWSIKGTNYLHNIIIQYIYIYHIIYYNYVIIVKLKIKLFIRLSII